MFAYKLRKKHYSSLYTKFNISINLINWCVKFKYVYTLFLIQFGLYNRPNVVHIINYIHYEVLRLNDSNP